MSNAIWAYRLTTALTPEKFYSEDETTGEIGETDQQTGTRKAALSRAHEIRKFEIEMYWKRAAHFWLLQAAVFTATGLTWRFSDASLSPLIPVALAALGTVTAFSGYLSARGSKFWQENWEHHIDMLEDEFEGRLHKTVYVGNEGIAWSVSGVNDRLAFCFLLFWLAILGSAVFAANSSWLRYVPDFVLTNGFQTGLILLAALTACGAIYARKTKFKGARGVSLTDKVPTIDASGWIDADKLPQIKDLTKLHEPFLIRREPKI